MLQFTVKVSTTSNIVMDYIDFSGNEQKNFSGLALVLSVRIQIPVFKTVSDRTIAVTHNAKSRNIKFIQVHSAKFSTSDTFYRLHNKTF